MDTPNEPVEGAQIAVSDQLTPALREFVQFGSDAIGTLSTAFQEGGLSGTMEALGTLLSEGLNMVIAQLPSMIEAGLQLLRAIGQGLMDNMPVIIDAAMSIVSMLATSIIENLPALASAAIEIIGTLVASIGVNLPVILAAGGQMLDQLVGGIESGLPDMISRLPQIIDDFLGFITENLPAILDKGVELLNSLVDGIIGAIPDLMDALPDVIDSIVTFIADNLPVILNSGIDILMNLVDGIIITIPKWWKSCRQLSHQSHLLWRRTSRKLFPLAGYLAELSNTAAQEEDNMRYYKKLNDVPRPYRPTIQKLMERGDMTGYSDPDPDSLEDNIINVSEDFCRILTLLDKMGKLD